ncbi:hypothetical protein FH603_509 [Spirosoma sp. LMG 31447]|uniref:Uncharacterized protein n=1 Tax=Spirosoma utsteinense TaxID=2585773 RepID=A0ABR6W0F4_9BACT|nr:hypothetical protein [Spirosoma utsteinense]
MIFQRQQIHAGHYNIPAYQSRVEGITAGHGSYYRQVFSLDKRNMSIPRLPAVMIAQQPFFLRNVNRGYNRHRRATFGTDTDPLHPAGPGKDIE